jgi:alpha-beta hydrolase superfamily lysophospholipase
VAEPVSTVREQVLLLGPRKSLLGILAQCAPCAADTARPAIVILNAGIVHRVGPSRMHVALARRLAAVGYAAVRFDLSGIGDSERRPDALTPLDAALADIREALDSLESGHQLRRAVLVGLCSGADQAVIYAGSDPRVVGVVLVDPHIPRTRQYYVHYYGSRLFRLSSWLGILLGKHPMWRARREGGVAADTRPDQNVVRELSSHEVRSFLEQAYRRTLETGTQFLAVFTGGLEAQHCYREQLLDAFPRLRFGDRLRLEYFKEADHMFQSEAERGRLIESIVNWLGQTRFAETQPPL